MIHVASGGIWAVTSWRVQSRVPVTGVKWSPSLVPGFLSDWRGRFFAGDTEYQSGAVGDVSGAQVAAEGDGAPAVVVGVDPLAERSVSGGLWHGSGQNRPPLLGCAGIVEPGALAHEGAVDGRND
jgi:hypothetical protein